MNQSNISAKKTKWSADRILSEARRRTRALNTDNTARVQKMLDHLVAEAGWTDSEFVDALCTDAMAPKASPL